MGCKRVVFEDKWLEFCFEEKKPKTKVYSVRSKCSECLLGVIKWYPAWRNYCYFPEQSILKDEFIYSDRCLISIGNFVEKLNEEHKKNVQKN